MKIFYINLEKRVDRKEHMEKMLSDLNLDYERFDAIRPTINEIKFGKYKKFYEKASGAIKSYVNEKKKHPRAIGVFGAYLSHLTIHKNLVGDTEPYMILEDDVFITENTLIELNKIISSDKYKNWDIIRSLWESEASTIVKIGFVHPGSKFSKPFNKPRTCGGAHFGVFKNAKRMVDYLSYENLIPIDGVYSTCKLNVFCTKLDVNLGGPQGYGKYGTDIPKM